MLILQLDSFISNCCLRPASRLIYFLIVLESKLSGFSGFIVISKFYTSTQCHRTGTAQDKWVSRVFSVKWEFVDWCLYLFFSWKHRWHALSRTTAPNVLLHLTKSALFPSTSSWQPYQRSQQIKSRLKQQYLFFFSSRVTKFFYHTPPKWYVLSTSVESAGRAGCAESFYRSTVKWENECYYCKRVVKLLMMVVSLQPYSEKKPRQADSFRC